MGLLVPKLIMILQWIVVVVALFNDAGVNGVSSNATRPDSVKIGATLTFNSTIGKVAKVALEAAIDDVNSDPSVLHGTKLEVTMTDTNYSGYLGIMESLSFMDGEIVAVIGPESSVTAHVVSLLANELQVPLLSYSSTDPTLASLQFPFFVMTNRNDLYQMAAIAQIVQHFEWREVIAIYGDDDYGRNGIAALGDKLAERRCKISYKAPLSPQATRDEITDVLVKVALAESRILLVHTFYSWGLTVFDVAQYLGMMGPGYVWIATNWLSTYLETYYPTPAEILNDVQGVLTLRAYTPDSDLKRNFTSRWKNLTDGTDFGSPIGLNTYGLYAYDTVWLLARALDEYFNHGGNVSFSKDTILTKERGGDLHLDAMNTFNGGKQLLRNIKQVNLTGVTGQISFSSDGNLIHPAYEIINVLGNGYRTVGYWSNDSGLSVLKPEILYSNPRSQFNKELYPSSGLDNQHGSHVVGCFRTTEDT